MWASILIKLAVSVLAYYNARADFRDKVLLEVRNAGLQVALEAESQREMQTMCVRLLAQEYGEIVTEYKAMCLALGHGAEYCGTSGVRMEPSLMPMVPVGTQAGGCFPVELRGQ